MSDEIDVIDDGIDETCMNGLNGSKHHTRKPLHVMV